MYTRNITRITEDQAKAAIQKRLDYMKRNYPHTYRKLDLSHFDTAVKELLKLNDALVSGRSVWATCEKYPSRLDLGRHYYMVWYVNDKGQREKFWPMSFGPLFGMDEQNRDRRMYKWVFSSRAIGMSRLLDATDTLGNIHKEAGGGYFQLEL